MRLIVNADDYGLTAGVNRGIEEAHERGVVTSTTVIAGGEASAAAAELPRRLPGLDVGLHVNLTLGDPLADPSQVRSLVDDEGRLLGERELLRRIARRAIRADEVHREVLAQADRLTALGLTLTHWDTHRGVAFWPGLRRAAAAAAADAGIRAVRSQRVWIVNRRKVGTYARWSWRLGRPRRLVGELSRRTASRRLSRAFAFPDWRTATNVVVGERDEEARWRQLLASLPPGVCEIVTHPGYPDARLAELTPNLADARLDEVNLLTAQWLRDCVVSLGIELVGFRSLTAAR